MLLLLLPLSSLLGFIDHHGNYGELAIQEHDQDEIIGFLYSYIVYIYNIFFLLNIFIYYSLEYIYIFHSKDIYLFDISSRHIIYLFIISC